jgi:hypothetical protein
MLTLPKILLVIALLCFVLAAVGVPTRGVSLLAVGLALWLLSLLVV